MSAPRLHSALRKKGQRSKNLSVSFNEALNQFMEPNYVILYNGASDPQLVSIRCLELVLAPDPCSVDGLTLSPPDGYKDCGAVRGRKARAKAGQLPRHTHWQTLLSLIQYYQCNSVLVLIYGFIIDYSLLVIFLHKIFE